MSDLWFYSRAGSAAGPVDYERLKELAQSGDLAPTDLVWPQGGAKRRAVEAQSVLPYAAFPRGADTTGNWLGKVAQSLASTPSAPGTTPDWLSDVEVGPVVEPLPAELPAAAASFQTQTVVPVGEEFRLVEVTPVSPAAGPPVARFVPYPPRLILGGATSRGRVRERNEDSFQTCQWNWTDADGTREVALLVVADGMGGYQAGDEASRLTVRTIVNHLSPVVLAARKTDGAAIASAIDQSVREANHVVHQQANKETRNKSMGATVAVVVVWEGRAYFAHVGDCRVYLHRGGELKQLTEDQTLVARMVALGTLTPQEAAEHPSRNEVTQAIGKRPIIDPSKGGEALARGDYLVVCCDGLAAHVESSTIQQVLNWPAVPSQHLASQLVQMADEGGGSDNCTVVVAHFA